jgi:hypothetical protein
MGHRAYVYPSPAGAVLASAAFAHFDPAIRLAALLLGGGIALSSHGTKAATRLGANLSPEPFSNIALSLGEDFIAIAASVLLAFHPVVLIGVVVVFFCVVVWLFPKIFRILRNALKGLRTKWFT